jgi:hypothetical protein
MKNLQFYKDNNLKLIPYQFVINWLGKEYCDEKLKTFEEDFDITWWYELNLDERLNYFTQEYFLEALEKCIDYHKKNK